MVVELYLKKGAKSLTDSTFFNIINDKMKRDLGSQCAIQVLGRLITTSLDKQPWVRCISIKSAAEALFHSQ